MTKQEIIDDIVYLDDQYRKSQLLWRELFDLHITRQEMESNVDIKKFKKNIHAVKDKYGPIFRKLDIDHDGYEANPTEDFLKFTIEIMENF